ncbi:MAG: hypothetical protein Q9217_006111, partial [Psora testacea]
MDSYQRSLIAEFFSRCRYTSQAECHRFVQQTLLSYLNAGSNTAVKVHPSPYQGSFSYTCIVDHHNPTFTGEHAVIQFRHEKIDLWGNTQAHQLHGQMAPLVRFQGTYSSLYVYTSPLAPGIPYVGLLTANEVPMSLDHRLRTVGDLAKALTHQARLPTGCASVDTDLSGIKSSVDCFNFQNKDLKHRITACISQIRQQDAHRAKLPIVLTHMDMTPFNYLVDAASGQVTAILDWDGAKYLPVGHNFHFVEHLFGYMTRDGWVDNEDREILESYFYEKARRHLVSQGFDESDLEALGHEKILGTLTYYVPKLLERKDGRAERYLK